MNRIVKYFFSLIHCVYNMRFYNTWNLYKKRLYSIWVRNEFKSIGEKCLFSKFSLLEGGKYIEIGNFSTFGESMVLTAWESYKYRDCNSTELVQQQFSPCIQIGNHCIFGDYNHLTSINKIEIEDGVLTGRWVTISDNAHGDFEKHEIQIPPAQRRIVSKAGIHICKNVWIGDKVTILAGVTIGEGSIIGSNSVVTKDVPKYSIVAGCPARVIRSLES